LFAEKLTYVFFIFALSTPPGRSGLLTPRSRNSNVNQRGERPGAVRGRGGAGAPPPPPTGPTPSWLAPGSPFGDINLKLREYIKPFPLAGMTVEPIMLALAAFCTFLFGIRGLMLAGIVFFVTSRGN